MLTFYASKAFLVVWTWLCHLFLRIKYQSAAPKRPTIYVIHSNSLKILLLKVKNTEDKCWHLRLRQEWQPRQPRSSWVWPYVQTCGRSKAYSKCLNLGLRCIVGNLRPVCNCHKWSISCGTSHFWLSSFQLRKLCQCNEDIHLFHLQRRFGPYLCKFGVCQGPSQLCSIPTNSSVKLERKNSSNCIV